MTNSSLSQAQDLIRNKPYLIWSTQKYEELSPESILESVISYGDWPDFVQLIKIFGLKESAKLFGELKNKHRTNLRPETTNYFTNYFGKYA